MSKEKYIQYFKNQADKKIDWLNQELAKIRSGRPNPKILDAIRIDYYGEKVALLTVAQVSVTQQREIIIKPFDAKNSINAIRDEILKANLGVTPTVDSDKIRLTFPPLTEQNRKDYVKNAKKVVEKVHQELRFVRQDTLKQIKNDEYKDEDFEKFLKEEVDKISKTYANKLDDIFKAKEKELLTI